MITLLLLKSLRGEFQGASILGHDANNVVGRTLRHLGADFERDLDRCAGLKGQVLNNFFGNFAGVPTNPLRIQLDCAEKAFWFGWRGRFARFSFDFSYG